MAITNMCAGCQCPINDMYHLIVGDQFYWHTSCLKCTVCQCMLQMDDKCYMNNGKFYCVDDYTNLSKNNALNQISDESNHYLKENSEASIAQSCRKCMKPISPNDYVINISKQASHLYHMNCFSCSDCNQLLSPGCPYGIYNQHVYCTQHYHNNVNPPQYTMLGSIASDNNLYQQNQSHLQQQQPITNYGEADQQVTTVPGHLQLQTQISVPNSAGPYSNNVNMDPSASMSSVSSSNSNSNSSSMSSSSSTSSSFSPVTQPMSQSSSNKLSSRGSNFTRMKSSDSNSHHHSHHNHQSSSRNQYLLSKKKRVRTSFKHQQLRIMKAHFQINQNPDSKDLKELSERTGLQKRVLQVWFQNSRAKQRKSSGPCTGLGPLGSISGMAGAQNGLIADSSINMEDEEIYSEDENDSEIDSSEVEKSMDNGRSQDQMTSNNLVDFYHY